MAARKPKSTNVAALERTLTRLTETGHIEADIDDAAVQALRSMAAALDDEPSNAALWRQYRDALAEVRRVDSDADAGLAAAYAEINGTAPMGDPPSTGA